LHNFHPDRCNIPSYIIFAWLIFILFYFTFLPLLFGTLFCLQLTWAHTSLPRPRVGTVRIFQCLHPSWYLFREVRRTGEFGREYVMERGQRPDNRYYGPGGEEEEQRVRARQASHWHHYQQEEEEETHYEGPTIFDKVFRKSSHKSVERSRHVSLQ
jgi:hypothetical protein